MNYPRILIATFIMALVTYLIRAIPLLLFRKKIKNIYVQSFLVSRALRGAGGDDISRHIAVNGNSGGGSCRLSRGSGVGLEE